MIQCFTLSSRRERVPHMGECEIVGIVASPEGTFVLFADYEAYQSRVERLEAALRDARHEIISLCKTAVERIEDAGGDCDPAIRTYEWPIAKIDAALGGDAGEGA